MELFIDYPEVVSVDDIMNMLHIGRSTVYNLLKSNQLTHRKIGRKYIIPKNSVIGFLDAMCYNDFQIIDGRLQPVMEGEESQ